jgi:hypothetical protein
LSFMSKSQLSCLLCMTLGMAFLTTVSHGVIPGYKSYKRESVDDYVSTLVDHSCAVREQRAREGF